MHKCFFKKLRYVFFPKELPLHRVYFSVVDQMFVIESDFGIPVKTFSTAKRVNLYLRNNLKLKEEI